MKLQYLMIQYLNFTDPADHSMSSNAEEYFLGRGIWTPERSGSCKAGFIRAGDKPIFAQARN